MKCTFELSKIPIVTAVLEKLDGFLTDNTEVHFISAEEKNELHDLGENWHTHTFNVLVDNVIYRIVHCARVWTGIRGKGCIQVWIYEL